MKLHFEPVHCFGKRGVGRHTEPAVDVREAPAQRNFLPQSAW
ncbi:hypothetical protein RESH_00481 [Rhodopirellula europaea SH398]|uniref:Uncharacterized protein n=1 Tax=Rhodopirellula europaea SH398 TaxID=1263868 RepID=M5SBX3_9BACT|nr:hypothetical protein RESH_00481 [Rhodopirellula europaea SH398]